MTKLALLTSAALLSAATAFAQTSTTPGASPNTATSGPASTGVAPRTTTGAGAATGAETTSNNSAGASNAEQPERASPQTSRQGGGTGGGGGGGSQ